jgi:N-acyl-D-aspartate/D-glutamate deacylase
MTTLIPGSAITWDALDRSPPALNAACLVGHSTLRVGAVSELNRAARCDEIAAMGESLQQALDAGALGLSTGLYYAPAFNALPTEVEALAARLVRPARSIRRICAMRPSMSSTASMRASL